MGGAAGRRARRTRIPADTLCAYAATDYRVEAPGPPFVLRIGRPAPALAALLRATRSPGAAYLTACNPRSRPLPAWANRRRQARLRRLLAAQPWTLLEGRGQHPRGRWPAEASLLVLGLSCAAARALGRRFQQNAIVWCGADAVPRLVLLR